MAKLSRVLSVIVTLLWRIAGSGLVVVVLVALVFLALRLLPGDPTTLILGDLAPASARAALRARLGLDDPLIVQYLHFLKGLFTLDLGDSLVRPGISAFDEVGRSLAPTTALAAWAVGLGSVLGVSAALLCVGPWLGRRSEWVHRGVLAVAASPLIAFAPLLTFAFAVELRIVPLPGDPESGFAGLLFAAGLLSLPLGAQVARIGRASLLEQGGEPYLRVVAAKGGSPLRIWFVHALPVAAAPIAVVIAAQLGALLGGVVVLEKLFERPGLGTLMIQAYASRDIPVLEASIVAAGLFFVVAQAAAVTAQALIDPRVRGA